MKRVALITDDGYFYKKCELLLLGIAELTDSAEGAALVARVEEQEGGERQLTVREGAAIRTLALPASLQALTEALTPDGGSAALGISEDGRTAYLRGEKIRLTESEGALLALLISGGGEFIPRERILSEVFPGKSEGMINVYIHYLREKLERGGEKIILSSRKEGYRINEKYLGGCENA